MRIKMRRGTKVESPTVSSLIERHQGCSGVSLGGGGVRVCLGVGLLIVGVWGRGLLEEYNKILMIIKLFSLKQGYLNIFNV